MSYRPGDSKILNTEILSLIRTGRKTVTCEAWSRFEDGEEELPLPGRIDIALNWSGKAACATETVAVERIRFCDITESHVAPQAEFRDLSHWRNGYRAYLERIGRYDAEAPMMLETFRLIEDFGA
jgi:uncharacterized protein YhfF